MITITIPLTDEQITNLTNGKSVVITPSTINLFNKTAVDSLKEKYESGKYICIYKEYIHLEDKHNYCWHIKENPLFTNIGEYKLIHKKHKEILDAYLADNSVEIEFSYGDAIVWDIQEDFISRYNEKKHYRLKLKPQYPIFKRNENGEVFRFEDSSSYPLVVLSDYRLNKHTSDDLSDTEIIPHDRERDLYQFQPVWCWDDTDPYMKQIRFYSREGSVVRHNNVQQMVTWDNMEPITSEQLKTMPFIWDMYTNLLKSLPNTQTP